MGVCVCVWSIKHLLLISQISSFNLCSLSSSAGNLLIIPTSQRSQPTRSVASPTTCWQCETRAGTTGTQMAKQTPASTAVLDKTLSTDPKIKVASEMRISFFFERASSLQTSQPGFESFNPQIRIWKKLWIQAAAQQSRNTHVGSFVKCLA